MWHSTADGTSYFGGAIVAVATNHALSLTHRETLALSKKVIGEEHPYTLISMHSLAFTLMNQRYINEALTLLEDCFVVGSQTFTCLSIYSRFLKCLRLGETSRNAWGLKALIFLLVNLFFVLDGQDSLNLYSSLAETISLVI